MSEQVQICLNCGEPLEIDNDGDFCEDCEDIYDEYRDDNDKSGGILIS